MLSYRTILALLALTSVLRAADLDGLATVRPGGGSLRASSFDRSGGNTDNIESFAPQTSQVLLDTDGPGRINHLWLTVSTFPNHWSYLRDLVIRITWENAAVPSVDVPLGDFFALGHSRRYSFQSATIAVGGNDKAMNCYWPMPFYKHARIEIVNNGRRSIRRLYYHVDYELGPQPPQQGLFHALFRYQRDLKTQAHEGNTTGRDNYVILDTEGQGQYAGCALFIDAPPGGWWGEGDDMIFIDHSEEPVIIGTGTEDYFNNAWGYDAAFSYPYYGCPLLEKRPNGGSFTTVYRWHIPDPIRFQKHIRVTIEHIYSSRVANDYSSVAYWYQLEPMRQRPPLPVAELNHPRRYPAAAPEAAVIELSATEFEPDLLRSGLAARALTAGLGDGYHEGGWLRIDEVARPVEISIPVVADGTYRVRLKPVSHVLQKPLRIALKGAAVQTFENRPGSERDVRYLDLGTATSQNKTLVVTLDGGPTIGIDYLLIERVTQPATSPAR